MSARDPADRTADEAADSPTEATSEAWRAILTHVRLSGPSTIEELMQATSRSKTATRAHLVRIEQAGLIHRVPMQPVGAGRPPLAFDLTEAGASVFPSEDTALLTRLVTHLENRGAGELLTEFFEQVWAERMHEVLGVLGVEHSSDVDLSVRIDAVATALEERGFMPIVSRHDDEGSVTVRVSECNCPLAAIARASRIPCKLEVEFLSRALGGRPRSVSIASRRTDRCTFEFAIEPRAGRGGSGPAAGDS